MKHESVLVTGPTRSGKTEHLRRVIQKLTTEPLPWSADDNPLFAHVEVFDPRGELPEPHQTLRSLEETARFEWARRTGILTEYGVSSWEDLEPETKWFEEFAPFYFILDECHRYRLPPTLHSLLTQGRTYGIYVVMAMIAPPQCDQMEGVTHLDLGADHRALAWLPEESDVSSPVIGKNTETGSAVTWNLRTTGHHLVVSTYPQEVQGYVDAVVNQMLGGVGVKEPEVTLDIVPCTPGTALEDVDEIVSLLREELELRSQMLVNHETDHWRNLPAKAIRENGLAPHLLVIPDYSGMTRAEQQYGGSVCEEDLKDEVEETLCMVAKHGASVGLHLMIVAVSPSLLPEAVRENMKCRVLFSHGAHSDLIQEVFNTDCLPSTKTLGYDPESGEEYPLTDSGWVVPDAESVPLPFQSITSRIEP